MMLRVIGLGQPAAGDDGAGPAVIEALRRRAVPPELELLTAADASALISLLETDAAVVVVDAAVGGRAGDVRVLDVHDLAALNVRPLSSHGMSVREAVEIARLVNARQPARVGVVAIVIDPPLGHRIGLSAGTSAAVQRAADAVLALARAPSPQRIAENHARR